MNIARAFGASARLVEARLGCKDPSRPHDAKSNPYQPGDGVFGNWTTSARCTVFDGTSTTAVHFGMLGPLARGERLATDYAEATNLRPKPRRARPTTSTS